MGDSGSESLPNVNVSLENLIKDQLNVNVKGVAAFLQTMFHEAACKRGYYFHLYAQYPRPECWLAAAIETLLWVRRTNKDEKAGGYFYKCCVRLHQTEMLPPESQALVAQYAHLSYAQVLAALTTPLPRAAASSTRPPGQPDQYALFVARRKEELKAEWQASHPGERLPANPFSGGGEEQYAAFLARRVQEVKAACAAARAAKGA